MTDRTLWIIIAATLLFVMLFFNRKVRFWAILKEQMKVFKNAKSQRISVWTVYAFWFFLGHFHASVFLS